MSNHLKVRLFSMPGCDRCKKVQDLLHRHGVRYEDVDADEDSTQTLCDQHDVDEVPHLQIINTDGKVLINLIGEPKDNYVDGFFLLCKMLEEDSG